MFCGTAFSKQKQPATQLNSIDTVPFLNHRWQENYFIGNGILGAGGDINGTWDFLIGPDYTSPNFLKSEIVTININGTSRSLPLSMHRIRSSGNYYGLIKMTEANIHVIDFASSGKPMITRFFNIENNSADQQLTIQLRAEIFNGKGINKEIVEKKTALLLSADTSTPLFGNGDGGYWKKSFALIAFSTKSTSLTSDLSATISTSTITIPPRQKQQIALVHYLFDDDKSAVDKYLKMIGSLNMAVEFEKSLLEWQTWLNKGKKFAVADQRVKDILESMLVGIRMQQNR
jgi:hypothetical protein